MMTDSEWFFCQSSLVSVWQWQSNLWQEKTATLLGLFLHIWRVDDHSGGLLALTGRAAAVKKRAGRRWQATGCGGMRVWQITVVQHVDQVLGGGSAQGGSGCAQTPTTLAACCLGPVGWTGLPLGFDHVQCGGQVPHLNSWKIQKMKKNNDNLATLWRFCHNLEVFSWKLATSLFLFLKAHFLCLRLLLLLQSPKKTSLADLFYCFFRTWF